MCETKAGWRQSSRVLGAHASEWVAVQNLADPNTWNCSSLTTLKQPHDQLLTHYNCTEWAPPPAADAPAPGAPAQGRDDDSARPLSFPPLNLLTSLRARQVQENGEDAARPSLPSEPSRIPRVWFCRCPWRDFLNKRNSLS
jgi:hypothetical protein